MLEPVVTRRRRGIFAAVLSLLALTLALAGQQPVYTIAGRVTTETNAAIGGARLLLRCAEGVTQGLSDPTGAFRFVRAGSAPCQLSAEREGYFPHKEFDVIPGTATQLQIILVPVRELVERLDVREDTVALDLDTAGTQEVASGREILNVPYPATNNLQNSLRIIPGVVQGSRGGLHLNGGGAEQTLYTLDGFNIGNPFTGRFDTRLSVESVQAVEVTSGPMSAEYGKGSAGNMAIRTRSGDDKFRMSATNFVPGFEHRKRIIIGNFTPRLNFSGPWKQGRAWFSNSADLQYDRTVVPELPDDRDSIYSWRGSNLFSNQINISPRNILFVNALGTFWTAPRTGLTALDPVETTVDRRARQFFFNFRNQHYFQRGALIEGGIGFNRTFGREIPQGVGLYEYTAAGKRGFYFRDSLQEAGRVQFLINSFLPSWQWRGTHQVKLGMDLNRVTFSQRVSRTGYRQYRASGTLLRETMFAGRGDLERNNTEWAFYVQDGWKLRAGMLLEAGMRWDWDQILRRANFSPRVGMAWSPAGRENLRVSGGVGYIYDATTLQLFVRPDDQIALTTYYGADALPIRGPALSQFLNDQRLRSPGFFTFSIGAEQRIRSATSVRVSYLAKRGLRGFTYRNAPLPDEVEQFRQVAGGGNGEVAIEGLYRLVNQRQDRYDAFEVTLRQRIGREYEWLASYIRSAARSNAASDISIDEPYVIDDNSGPLAWDTPNRLVTWGYLPTPFEKWAAAYLLEWRNGFPYSVLDEDGRVRGTVHSRRFPMFLELNLHLERRVRLFSQTWALRGGVNNVTGRHNPLIVNNFAGAPDFLRYFGGFGRSLNFRIRWLGRN